MRGGSSRSGVAPDPQALRRDRAGDAEWTDLPAAGRQGPPPPWPLGTNATNRQSELWEYLWARPQAIMWELRGQELEVALYVRRFSEAERPNSSVTLNTWIRQQMEQLGLSSMGLRANRWRIVADAPTPVDHSEAEPDGGSVRDRLRVIRSDAG